MADIIANWVGKIHQGDCLEVMGRMPANSVGLIVTSPPYNILNCNGKKNDWSCKTGLWNKASLLTGYIGHSDFMPHKKYVEWQRDCLSAMMRLLRDDGAIFYNHKWRVQGGLLQDRSDIVSGFPVRQIIIWHRPGGSVNFCATHFLPSYEVIYVICKKKFRLARKEGNVGDVWKIPSEKDNRHPAPFPVELARRCIVSTMAQVILDPFMGSGSTAIAAEFCKRQWVGIEQSEEYCDLAERRIEEARSEDVRTAIRNRAYFKSNEKGAREHKQTLVPQFAYKQEFTILRTGMENSVKRMVLLAKEDNEAYYGYDARNLGMPLTRYGKDVWKKVKEVD